MHKNIYFPFYCSAVCNWNQSSHSADARSLQDQASAPFVSISQSGRCSPGTDPNLHQPGEWLPGLDTTRGNVPGLENLQADGPDCSAPASGSTGVDPSCFPPGYDVGKTSDEGDARSFPFLNQESENQNTEQSPNMGPRDARPDNPQTSSGGTAWPRADRVIRSPSHHARRITSFVTRVPLRPQLTSPSLAVRQLNTVLPPPAPGGGSARPYSCPYCTKCFTYPSHQRRHLLRHTGVRLHPCQFCDKSFLTPSELTVHTRTHTGERPFGCAQCGKRFARSGNLRAHQRDVHMGKRPFVCAECGKRFAHRGNLRVHNHRVHQGDPYYIDDQPDLGPNAI